MSSYDLGTLTDRDFERLSNDIIAKKEDTHVEEFKIGKDGGIDGRFQDSHGRSGIVQAKHYWKSGLGKLLSHCKKTEAEKVKLLEPDRYVFVCSSELSPDNKTKIELIFHPYIKNPNDIYGLNEITSFLDEPKNIDIVKKNYKLWITSTNVLNLVLHSGLYSRSRNKLEDIIEKFKFYVKTSNHNKALRKLEDSHSLIITGEPGVGKSTLAEQMCNYLVASNYKFFEVNEIKDAWEGLEEDTKQVFFFDDFLGANYLEAITDNHDSSVMKFINLVKKNNNKRFILTSRTSIFTQGMLKSNSFQRENIESNEFLLNIRALTKAEKGEILYNHVYHSGLNKNISCQFFTDQRHREIIRHRNFNPRLIEFITSPYHSSQYLEDDYWSFVTNSLMNPAEIWKHAVENQLTKHERILIYFVVCCTNISEKNLRNAFESYIKSNPFDSKTETPFTNASNILTGAFLKKELRYNTMSYTVINPSLADYILPILFKETTLKADILFHLWPHIKSLRIIKSLISSGKNYSEITSRLNEISGKLLTTILEKGEYENYSPLAEFIIRFQEEGANKNSFLTKFVDDINTNGASSIEAISTIDSLSETERSYVEDSINWDKVFLTALDHSPKHKDLVIFSRLFYSKEEALQNPDIILSKLTECVLEYWSLEIDDHLEDCINLDIDYDEEFDAAWAEDEIESLADTAASDILNEYYVSLDCHEDEILFSANLDHYLADAKEEHEKYELLKSGITFSTQSHRTTTIKKEEDWSRADDLFARKSINV